MSSNIYLKKLDKIIDTQSQKNVKSFNLDPFVSYIISKYNNPSQNNQETISNFENILIKLLHNNFDTTVKTFCYYLICNFNHEFSETFFKQINSEIFNDNNSFNKFDLNINSLKLFFTLDDKDIIENLNFLENIFKVKKFDFNYIINSFYYSNFPVLLLSLFNKINYDDFRIFKTYLINFFLELCNILIFNKNTNDGTFLNLIKILNKTIINFKTFEKINTIDKIINSIIIKIVEFFFKNNAEGLYDIIILLKSFDNKLLNGCINFPINLYKIYIFFLDENNKNSKQTNNINNIIFNYISFLFKELRNVIDPDIFSEFNKTILEFLILSKNFNISKNFGSEILSIFSLFLTFSDHFDKSTWFDSNIKLLSKLVEFLDNNNIIDISLLLLSLTKNIKNYNDRIITIFSLFSNLIFLAINYSKFFSNESLILCLFKQDWFVLLINKEDVDNRESLWRNDLFISLIEALLFYKIKIFEKKNFKKILILYTICQDIIDVCFKVLDWKDDCGEAIKMYFLILEETCLFFNESFFNSIFKDNDEYIKMKKRSEDILYEIYKRFNSKNWNNITFSNEYSKYKSIKILAEFMDFNAKEKDKDKDINIDNIIEVIFMRLNDISLDNKNEKFYEEILRAILCIGIRLKNYNHTYNLKEKIVNNLTNFNENLNNNMKNNNNCDLQLTNNLQNFSEKIKNFLLKFYYKKENNNNNNNNNQIIIDKNFLDKLNNNFYLFIPKSIENNIFLKNANVNYNNLYLINLNVNCYNILSKLYKKNSSIYLDNIINYYTFPLLEFNNDNCHNCHMIIDNLDRYIFSEWKLITGISDPIHIYYNFKIDIEKREIELFIKIFNNVSVVLNNVYLKTYLSENLILFNEKNLSNNYNTYNNKEFYIEILSPFTYYDFTVKFYSKKFDKNNINIDCSFDMKIIDNNPTTNTPINTITNFRLNSENFYIPLDYFLIKDNFSLYDNNKYNVFYNTLEYAFTVKCFTDCNPNEIINNISKNISIIEYITNNINKNKENETFEKIKKKFNYEDNVFDFNLDENINYNNFKIKLAAFSIYNFWVYIVIMGDYSFQNNKSILNIEVKTNDLSALKTISKEKNDFFKEIMGRKIKFY